MAARVPAIWAESGWVSGEPDVLGELRGFPPRWWRQSPAYLALLALCPYGPQSYLLQTRCCASPKMHVLLC